MEKMKAKILEIVKEKAFQFAEIETKDLVFDEFVVNACKANYCGKYGKSWVCPPALGSLDELKAKILKHEKALVYTTKHNLEDSFDFEGMMAAKEEHVNIDLLFQNEVTALGGFALGAGGCSKCERCTYPDSPCRFPDIAKPSVEAHGIDVTKLATTANINYHNGVNTVTYFTLILW